jgi:uncharacterized membrane protein YgcG
MDDLWDECFGPPSGDSRTSAPLAPIVPIPGKRQRAVDEKAAALLPLADADGNAVIVPAPPQDVTCSSNYAYSSSYADQDLWLEHPPIHAGPIELRLYPDCGRGFAASRDVAPGEILMIEAPLVEWPGVERGAEPLLREVLGSEARESALAALAQLHPVSIELVSAEAQARLAREHAEAIDKLLPMWQQAYAHDTEAEARRKLLRLCLAVRWNAFDSGLFLHEAIFNHATARLANADKASVKCRSRSGHANQAKSSGKAVLSIVRATRPIAQGDQILISYLQPAELSRAMSVARLRQFDFGMEGTPPHPEWDRAPVDFVPTAAAGSAAAVLEEAEEATRRLEEAASTAIKSALTMKGGGSSSNGGGGGSAGGGGDMAAGLKAAYEAVDALATQLGPRHLGVACARRQLLSGLRRWLHAGDAHAEASRSSTAGGEGSAEALLAVLDHSLELWTTQRAVLGPLHPDCAETMHDIATSLDTLLASAPRALTDRFAHVWSSPALASHAHGRAKQLRDTIAALYDLTDLESGQSPLCRAAHEALD